MFKKLLSDKVIVKLKKIPTVVWYLIYGLAAMFASLYTLINIGPEISDFMAAYNQGLNMERVMWLVYPMMLILEVVIFEFLAYLAHIIISRRYFIEISQSDFSFRLRIFVIIANLATGIVSLIYFAFPQAIMICSAIINPLFLGVMLIIFLFEICKKYVGSGMNAKAFGYLSRIYLVINIAFALLNFLSVFTYDSSTTLEIIAGAVKIAVYGLLLLLAYYYYKKLKDSPIEPPKAKIEIAEEKKDDTIFKDFGF